MMELVIDTASGALSVALIDGSDLIAEHHEIIGRGHAETVIGVVAEIVNDRGGKITGVVVDTGPGSFTGVRIGVAAARALGLAWNVPVAGVSGLALVAAAAFAAGPLETVTARIDAGRGRVYTQTFARDGCRPLCEPAVGGATEGEGFAVPRAADARHLPITARGPALPLYLGGAALTASATAATA